MLSLEKLRQIDPDLKQMPDKELRILRDTLHGFSRLILASLREAMKDPLYGLVLVGIAEICDNDE